MLNTLRLTVLTLGVLAPASSAQIEIRVLADPAGRDERNLNGEYAIVYNRATTPLDVSGWWLCNAVASCFVFPEDSWVGSGGGLRVHTGQGPDTAREVHMGRDRPVWANWADMATLSDRTGEVRARCVWDRGRGMDCSPP